MTDPTESLLQQAAQAKHVLDARRKFAQVLDDEVLDYKHNHPVNIENCVTMIKRIFVNVLDHPQEGKFRQVKATSNAFKNNITTQKGGEHLVTLAGWRPQVVDYQKFWNFDGEEGSTKFKILREAVEVLDKAMHTVHEKAERKRKEQDERKQKMTDERERIRLQIEDDKAQRKLRNEVMAVHDEVVEGHSDGHTSPRVARTSGPGADHPLLQQALSSPRGKQAPAQGVQLPPASLSNE